MWKNQIKQYFAISLLLILNMGTAIAYAEDKPFPIGNADIKGVDETPSNEALDATDAFAFAPPTIQGQALHLMWKIAPHHYLYADKFKVEISDTQNIQLETALIPSGQTKEDEFFGRVQAVYDQADITVPLVRDSSQKTAQFTVVVAWQGCADGRLCYPPETRAFNVAFAANATTAQITPVTPPETTALSVQQASVSSAAPMAEQETIAATLRNGNIGLTVLSFFGFGLLLAFTPCVFPMIPILSGIIAGQKTLDTRKAFSLSLVYVLAMAVTYTTAGVLAGVFGENLQALFQNPWVLGTFSAIFVLLALSMFGFYELQIPNAMQSRLTLWSNAQSGGTFVGVAIMGVLSALIVGPCVAAPLAGALIYIGQTGDAWLGGFALFALSLGMGVPLLLIGTSAGTWLPQAGMWMETIRTIFGVLLLAVAIWLLERVLPHSVGLMLWACLFMVSAIYMGALRHLPEDSSGWLKLSKGIGIIFLVYGSLVLVGSASGSKYATLLQPLKGLSAGVQASTTHPTAFRLIKNLTELQTQLKQANGKPVLVDFYADWCTSCKEMEAYTYPDPAVQTILQNWLLLKVDVTANHAEHKALMKHFQIAGAPATLLFDKKGQELRSQRLVGFVAADTFVQRLQQAMP